MTSSLRLPLWGTGRGEPFEFENALRAAPASAARLLPTMSSPSLGDEGRIELSGQRRCRAGGAFRMLGFWSDAAARVVALQPRDSAVSGACVAAFLAGKKEAQRMCPALFRAQRMHVSQLQLRGFSDDFVAGYFGVESVLRGMNRTRVVRSLGVACRF